MIEAEIIDYSIKAVGKAILFVGFVAFLGMWFFTWYDECLPVGAIQDAVKGGVLTKEDIVNRFREQLDTWF